MDSQAFESIDEQPKRLCHTCQRVFDAETAVCPLDGTLLVPTHEDPLIGTILADRYEMLGILGAGGMGKVYKARHKLMRRIVAIKVVHPHLFSSKGTMARFQQEAEAVSRLNHPNIVSVHDFGLVPVGYLVMDYLDGITLADLLDNDAAIPLDRCMAIFDQICAGLAHAHEHGIVHRDLKPSNIMLTNTRGQTDLVKLVDFGIAKVIQTGIGESKHLTVEGDIFGSPFYLSPEQCQAKIVDGRSDIYSLGCIMYRTVTGRQPIHGQELMECLYNHVHTMPEGFQNACPELNLPDALQSIIMRCLAKDPEKRYQSVAQLQQALAALDWRGNENPLPDQSENSPAASRRAGTAGETRQAASAAEASRAATAAEASLAATAIEEGLAASATEAERAAGAVEDRLAASAAEAGRAATAAESARAKSAAEVGRAASAAEAGRAAAAHEAGRAASADEARQIASAAEATLAAAAAESGRAAAAAESARAAAGTVPGFEASEAEISFSKTAAELERHASAAEAKRAAAAAESARVASASEANLVASASEAARAASAAEAGLAASAVEAERAASAIENRLAASAHEAALAASAREAGLAASAVEAGRAATAAEAGRAATAAEAGRAADAREAGRAASVAEAGRAADAAQLGRDVSAFEAGRAAAAEAERAASQEDSS